MQARLPLRSPAGGFLGTQSARSAALTAGDRSPTQAVMDQAGKRRQAFGDLTNQHVPEQNASEKVRLGKPLVPAGLADTGSPPAGRQAADIPLHAPNALRTAAVAGCRPTGAAASLPRARVWSPAARCVAAALRGYLRALPRRNVRLPH